MKKLFWTLIVLAPFACSAQMVNSPVVPVGAEVPVIQSLPKAGVYSSPGQSYPGALNSVRERLELTPAQQALWHDYEVSIDAYNGLHYREMPVMPTQGEKAPRQIGRLVDNLQNRLAALEDVEQAAKKLYAGLTAPQQLTADQLLLSTVPTFVSSAGSMNAPSGSGSRQNGRSDGGMRSRRGGSSGGGLGGGF